MSNCACGCWICLRDRCVCRDCRTQGGFHRGARALHRPAGQAASGQRGAPIPSSTSAPTSASATSIRGESCFYSGTRWPMRPASPSRPPPPSASTMRSAASTSRAGIIPKNSRRTIFRCSSCCRIPNSTEVAAIDPGTALELFKTPVGGFSNGSARVRHVLHVQA